MRADGVILVPVQFLRGYVERIGRARSMRQDAWTVEPSVIDEVEVDFSHARGTVRLEEATDGFAVAIELDSDDPVDIVLAFDGREVGLREFTQDLGEISALQVTYDSIAWAQRGHHRVAVLLEPRGETPAMVDLQFFAYGNLIQSTALELPGSG